MVEISHGDLKVWNIWISFLMNHESCYVLCYLVTSGNTTEHEYDHDSKFEFDEGDDESLKTPKNC